MKKYANPEADRSYAYIVENIVDFPFSFKYDGEEISGFSDARMSLDDKKVFTLDEKERSVFTFVFDGALKITLDLLHYFDFGATEWTVYLDNISNKPSGVISEMKSTVRFDGGYPTLKGILGDHVNQYRPYSIDLTNNATCFSSESGRATHINFPYFNLEYGDKGAMLAIGWAGTWKAEFTSDGESTVYVARSVNNLSCRLNAGEGIRSALFVVAPYTKRNESYATNYWRSWFIKHNLPKANSKGEAMTPISTCCLALDTGIPNSDGSISESHTSWRPTLEKMLSENIKIDFRWFDAGWYIAPDGRSPRTGIEWWEMVGTWELDPAKWPGETFRESTDFAREHQMKTLMWFEPERISDPENLVKNYGYKDEWAIRRDGVHAISNNIGNPECFEWTLDRVCSTLKRGRVEMYREDNNCDPAPLWKYLDDIEGEDRRGITECRFINGHYKMWDEIIKCTLSYGGCGFVDSCASGGGRNDIESMRSGVPLLRSDADRTSTSLRLSMTTSFNKWIPFCGANSREKVGELDATGKSDTYIWRASYLPVLNVDSQFVYDPTQNFDVLRNGLNEWRKINKYLLKDFYIHTPWHRSEDKSDFTAYSYFDDDAGEGILFVFRQEECELDTLRVSLPYADIEKKYRLKDEDSGEETVFTGKELGTGVEFVLKDRRSARLIYVNEI
ncbi:MAG: alpha-galactosidase [Clostridia bacterium]|nr:alpha-galactosidase [Clostridia bacterium]